MNKTNQDFATDPLAGGENFSLVLGGPLFQFFRRTRMTDDELALVQRRMVAIALICWLPLLILCGFQGQLLGGGVVVPFLKDADAHIRLLVVVPMLVWAELFVHHRMRSIAAQFRERDLIAEADVVRFNAAINAAMRLRNSVVAEVAMIAVVYLVGVMVVWNQHLTLDVTTWYSRPGGSWSLSAAGWWFALVSLPVFQFLLLRWYFRIAVWVRFLWQVSRIKLQLIPTHPDRVGGLGFLSGTSYAFVPLLMAHGALLAGMIADRIFHQGETLVDFKYDVILVVIFLLVLVQGPLLLFAPQLAATKRKGKREYGLLSQRYVREYDQKWLRGGADPAEPFLGSADIQSLADLGNGYDTITSMRASLFSSQALLTFAGAIIAPIVPLLLTMMPLDDFLKRVFGVIF